MLHLLGGIVRFAKILGRGKNGLKRESEEGRLPDGSRGRYIVPLHEVGVWTVLAGCVRLWLRKKDPARRLASPSVG